MPEPTGVLRPLEEQILLIHVNEGFDVDRKDKFLLLSQSTTQTARLPPSEWSDDAEQRVLLVTFARRKDAQEDDSPGEFVTPLGEFATPLSTTEDRVDLDAEDLDAHSVAQDNADAEDPLAATVSESSAEPWEQDVRADAQHDPPGRSAFGRLFSFWWSAPEEETRA